MHFSVLDPASPQAAERLWLWNACMWVCGFILALVAGLIVYILFRYRHGNARQPSQTTGNKKLEVTWTAVPIGLVAFLFVLSALAARARWIVPSAVNRTSSSPGINGGGKSDIPPPM